MCYSFDFDPMNRILRFCLKGHITDELMKDFHEGMKEPARRAQPDAVVVDTSTVVSFEVPSQAIRELVGMFERDGRGTCPNFHVVRAGKEAWAILGVQNPRFESLDTA